MLATAWTGAWSLWRGRTPHIQSSWRSPWLLRAFVAMTFSGWVATLAGWYTAEVGRQPWLVHDVLTTAEAVADVSAPAVATTLAVYLTVYAALTVAYVGVLFYTARRETLGAVAAPGVEPSTTAHLGLSTVVAR